MVFNESQLNMSQFPSFTGREVIAALSKVGFEVARIRSSQSQLLETLCFDFAQHKESVRGSHAFTHSKILNPILRLLSTYFDYTLLYERLRQRLRSGQAQYKSLKASRSVTIKKFRGLYLFISGHHIYDTL